MCLGKSSRAPAESPAFTNHHERGMFTWTLCTQDDIMLIEFSLIGKAKRSYSSAQQKSSGHCLFFGCYAQNLCEEGDQCTEHERGVSRSDVQELPDNCFVSFGRSGTYRVLTVCQVLTEH